MTTRLLRLALIAAAALGIAGAAPARASTASFDRTHVYFSGKWDFAAGGSANYFNAGGADSTCLFVATGTACTGNVYAVDNASGEYRVDGGAWAFIVPSANNSNVPFTYFTGLADGPHTVEVRGIKTAFFYVFQAPGDFSSSGPLITVTGASPNCAPPAGLASTGNYLLGTATTDGAGQVGALNNVRLESGYGTANDSAAGYNPIPKNANFVGGSDGSYSNVNYAAQIRFKATTTQIDIWIKNDGQAYGLVIDGVYPVNRVITPNTLRWGWVTLATGLDGGSEHTYGVVISTAIGSDISAGSGEVWSLRTPGGTMNVASQPALRDTVVFLGDSITAGQDGLKAAVDGRADESDALTGWVPRTAERLGMQFYNAGIGSSTLLDYTGHTAGNTSPDLFTKYSGQARASHDVVNAPTHSTPTKVVVLYGVNDVQQAAINQGGSYVDTVTLFGGAVTSTANTINAGLPLADVYWMGILPTGSTYAGGYGEADRLAFNNAIQSALAAIGNAKNHYIDLDHSGFAGAPGDASGTDFALTTLDRLHPSRLGRRLVFEALYSGMTATKTLGIVPARDVNPLIVPAYPSQAYTLRVSGNGGTGFIASHSLTASAGTLGSPTVSNDGFLTVPWTAPASPQVVTITDTGSGATGTFNCVVPTLALSQSSANPGDVVTITFTAPFTYWLASGQAGLFTSPTVGLAGATVSGLGTATATFTVPNTPGGSVVITDTSTGQAATLAIAGTPGDVPLINGGLRRRASIDRAPGPPTPSLDLLDTRRRRKAA